MKTGRPWLRLVCAVLVVALAVTLVAPSRADAMDPLTIIAIASAAAAVLVLVIYLVVANTADKQMKSDAPEGRWMACTESEPGSRVCWPIAPPTGDLAAALTVQTQ